MIITKWPGIENAPKEFIFAVMDGAAKRGWDGDSLLGHISSESNFNPKIRNSQPGQSATGLIQVINSTARSLGFNSAADIANLGFMEQLEKVIWPYFEKAGGGKQLHGADYKLLGFSGNPALIGANPSRIIYDDPRVVALNKFADMDGDGVLTVNDIRVFWNAFAKRFPKINVEELKKKIISKPKSGGIAKSLIIVTLLGLIPFAHIAISRGKNAKKEP